jgi:predicted lipid-binding transport protein (Tim44 family)
MSKHFGLLSILFSALALAPAAPAVAAPKVPSVQAARIGGRAFGRPRYTTRYRSPYRRTYGRPYRSPFHGLGGAILKGLGLAYLFHALFGWGAGGGSPFGLLLLVAILAYVAGRARRRRPSYR